MRRILILAILHVFTTSLSKAATSDEVLSNIPLNTNEDVTGNMTIEESWENFEKMVKKAANNIVKKALPSVMEYSTSLNLSTECMRNSMHLINGLKNIKPWAMRCK